MKKDIVKIILVFIVVSLTFFSFIKLRLGSLNSIYKSWDGPSYAIAAQSLYVPAVASQYNSIQSPEIRPDFTFLPAHFPLYPLLIRSLSFLGLYQAMLLIALVFSLAAIIAFYLLAREFKLHNPLYLTLPLVILPPRWFIISHIGSSEPIFLFFVLLSLIFYFRRSPWISAICASLSLLARPQGALLGLGFLTMAAVQLYQTRDLKKIVNRYLPYILMPLTLVGIFIFYKQQTGDFWAFFRAIAIFQHFEFSLFPTFNYGAKNVETFWQEANALYYSLYLASIVELISRPKHWQLGVLGIMFYAPLIFLQHSDISRYSLPLMPLAFIAFAPYITKKSVSWAAFLSIPAVFLYSANFILFNHAP